MEEGIPSITGDRGQRVTVAGWDFAEDYVWPQTETLFIVGLLQLYSLHKINILSEDFPDSITVSSHGKAGEKYPDLMGDYILDTTMTAQLRKVYKKTDGDYYIFYASKFLL